MKDQLSPACQRALDLAFLLAWNKGMENPTPQDCLGALLLDEEGPVSSLFLKLGASESAIQEFVPLRLDPSDAFPIPPLGKSRLERKIIQFSKKELGEQEGTSLGFLRVLLEDPNILADDFLSLGISTASLLNQFTLLAPEPIRLASPLFADEDVYPDSTFRILDASANRVREGLRVVEDFARFHLDHPILCSQIKQVRHDFRESLRWLDINSLLSHRSTEEDVGKDIHTQAEFSRSSPLDTSQANLKRVQEALRSLEEYGKLESPEFALDISKIRYKTYELEQQLHHATWVQEKLQNVLIYALVGKEQLQDNNLQTLETLLSNGIDMVQLRIKNATDRTVLEYASILNSITRPLGIPMILNDRADLALIADADGVHLGQDDISIHQARKILGSHRIVGISTHNIEQAENAIKSGADYLGTGPTFASKTKSFNHFPGLPFIQEASILSGPPKFAIGGIHSENIHEAVQHGASRVAISFGLFNDENPLLALKTIRQALAIKR